MYVCVCVCVCFIIIIIFICISFFKHISKWQAFKISGPVHTLRQQHLIYRKCQRTPGEDVDCYWQVIEHMVDWSIRENKTWFLPSVSCIHTTIWMHHIDVNKMHRAKAKRELHKNTVCCLEQIPEVTPYKTADVRSLTSHLTDKTNKTCKGITGEAKTNS